MSKRDSEPEGRFRSARPSRLSDREVEMVALAAAVQFLQAGGSRASWLRLFDQAAAAALVAYKRSETREAS
jgi:hypothetical protein